MNPDLILVNTRIINLDGTDTLSIRYGSDDVFLLESESEELVLKEYMTEDKNRYYAEVSQSAGTVSIKQGYRPWMDWKWKARAEIYLPRSFRENLLLTNSSGNLTGKTDLLDYRTLDISVSSGYASFMRISAETLSARVSSGDLEILEAEGNSLISVSSGHMQIGELRGGEHRIKGSSGRTRIDTIRGGNTIEISSGNMDINRIEGDSSIEIKSGSIQIADISGTNHRLKASSGNAVFKKIRGAVDFRGSSGTINFDDFSGEGSFEMSSGNLRVVIQELTGDLRFDIASGDIRLDIAREIPFNLDAVTNSGGVRVTEGGDDLLRVSGNSTVLRPIGPSPEKTIYAHTRSGSIRIDRR
jgi:DUF4097 and DUF4098 domain-containing protein YvlB